MKTCYCCSNLAFEDCCEPYLLGIQKVPTAEALMRSRYSAYCTHNADYLLATTHISTRKFHNKKEILTWATQNSWLKLEIVEVTEKTVEFKTYFIDNGLQSHCHHEKSTFKKQGEQWYYVDGKFF
ncbi:MAG: YchJ family metal-binding protein [Limnohabitans sp.]|nr:YchJ family metal-binding protein [Limnohabitans sp.]